MKGYILAVAGVILLSAVVACIAPSGKMGRFVKGMMKLVILAVMISPMLGWVRSGTLDLSAASSIGTDEGYLRACSERLEEEDERAIAAFLLSDFSLSAEVDVTRSDDPSFEREKIRIILPAEGINGEEERINIMTRIREAVAARYGCEVEVS